MKKALQLFSIFSICANLCYAQNNSAHKITVLTADSLASGNYKDVLTSFFQLAFNDLSGPQKALSVATNPYAIMVRANPNLAVDTEYVKYKHLRNLNFNVSVLIDSAYHLNGFSFGAKYALINARDNTVSHDFLVRASKENDFSRLTEIVGQLLSNTAYERAFREKLAPALTSLQEDSTVTFNTLDKRIQEVLDSIITVNHLTNLKTLLDKNPNLNFRTENMKSYEALVDEWQNKPLWTVAANSTFAREPSAAGGSNGLVANNVLLSSEFLLGLNSPESKIKLEMDLLAIDSLTNDTLHTQPNIKRNVFSFEPGLNFVFKPKSNGKPFIELKLSGTYYHTFSTLYPKQSADNSTINAVVRFRIIDDLWVPITFKMDENGHIYGTLDVKFNFTTLANVLHNPGGK